MHTFFIQLQQKMASLYSVLDPPWSRSTHLSYIEVGQYWRE